MNEKNYEIAYPVDETPTDPKAEKRAKKEDIREAKKELARHNAANPFQPTFRWDGSKRHGVAKRVVAILLALALTASVTVFCVINIDSLQGFFSSFFTSEDNATSGNCGSEETNDVVKWDLNSFGVLSITGSGEMQNYARFEDAPWAPHADAIKTVSIGKDVEWVSLAAFKGCTSLEAFRVEDENAYYAVSDSALYDSAYTTLLLYPVAARNVVINLKNGVKYVADGAFSANVNAETINIPSSLISFGKQDLTGFTALKTINYAGNTESWEALATGVTLGDDVTVVTDAAAGDGASLGLVADHYYEYIATSADVTRGSGATLLMDGSTVFLDAGNSNSYIEVTIPCTRPGIYALTMKEFHGPGQLDYVTVVNRSVTYFSSITSGNRFTELSSEIPHANTLSPEYYLVPAEVEGGEYLNYYAYTYLQAGMNRVRIALKGGTSKIKYDMGVSSFRFDLVSADTESTETVFATDPAVVDHFVAGENVGRNSGGTGSFYRKSGSFDVSINIKKEAIYDVYLMMAGTSNPMEISRYGEKDPIFSRKVVSSAVGSTALVPTKAASLELAPGEQTLTFTVKGSFVNLGLIRFVPQGEEPLGEQTVTGLPEATLGEGEADLMGAFTPNGASKYENGSYRLLAGKDNALTANVTVEESGVYAIRLRGVFTDVYYLKNLSAPSQLSLFVTMNKDASLGWEYAADGYGNYTVYQYLRAGENELCFYSDSTATVDAMKLLKLTDAEPTLILLSTNTSGENALASKAYYWAKVTSTDALTYNVRITEGGTYRLSGLIGGNASTLEIRDAENKTVRTIEVNPGKLQNPAEGLIGQTDAVIYAEIASVELSAGEYTVVAKGATTAAALYSQLYLTNAAATESGIVWANLDFASTAVPGPSDVADPAEAVDISSAEVKVGSKSGVALNGNFLVYGGTANGVYFNVTAATEGFYQLELAMLCRDMDKVYARLYNPAVTGNMVSVNRDAGLGATRNTYGYSPYGYTVYLAEGENKIYFEHSGGANGYMDITAARITRLVSNKYTHFLSPIKDKSVGKFDLNNAVAQLRPAGYEDVVANQYVTYEVTPTDGGIYSIELFAAGSGQTLLRAYEGTGDTKKDISSKLNFGNKQHVSKDGNGLTFTVSNLQAADNKLEGSNNVTARTFGIGTITLEAGKSYTFVVECVKGYVNASAFVLSCSTAENATVKHTFGKLAYEDCKPSNLLSVPLGEAPTDVYDGENEDKLVRNPAIDGSELVALETPLRMNPSAQISVNVETAGIYKLIVNGYVAESVTLTATANGASSYAVIDPVALGEGVTADPSNSAHRSYVDVYVYLAAGENTVTLTADGMRLYAYLVRGVEEVNTVLTHQNFIGVSVLPDNGKYPVGYYVLRQGDSVGIKDAYVTVDGGVWLSAFAGGNGYVKYTFENVMTGECIEEIYNLTATLEGQSIATLATGYARLGYIALPAGKYTVTVTLVQGTYAVLSNSFLAAETHEHVYDKHFSVAATCALDGISYDYCFCGAIDESSVTVLPATGEHDYQLVVAKEATCVESGYKIKVCSVCDAVMSGYSEDIAKDPNAHGFTDWVITEPTVEANGFATRGCIYCDHTEERELSLMMQGEDFSVDTESITVSADKKTLTVSVTAPIGGFYHVTVETLLTPSKTNEAYITAESTALLGYVSKSKSFLNETKTSYEFQTGLSVYLTAGENTLTFKTEGKFENEVKKIGFIFADSAIDAAAVDAATNFGSSYLGNKKAEYSLTVTDSGFYKIGYLYCVSGNAKMDIAFTDKNSGETPISYVLDLNAAQASLTEGVSASVGSTGVSQYIAGEYVYLEAGEYTITVTPIENSFFCCFAGMTFICVDAIPSTDIEDGSGL